MLGPNQKIVLTVLWLTLSFSISPLHANENYQSFAKLDLPALSDTPLFSENVTLKITLNEEPLAALQKEPSAVLQKELSASPDKEPSASINKEPPASVNKEPAASSTKPKEEIDTPSKEEIARQAQEEQKAALMQQVLLKIYRSNLLKKTYKHVVYPESSIELNEEGEVVLIVNVDRSGKVLDVNYESRTPSKALNRAATNAVKRAKPFSAAPDALVGEKFAIRMPIRFRLTN